MKELQSLSGKLLELSHYLEDKYRKGMLTDKDLPEMIDNCRTGMQTIEKIIY